ncbi:hypothetical protein PTH_2580 [Pelotomaculum thermopropionicum SI]|uniref:Uncharacterized protein n=1 Tax=Pelotomaculum thermopropionicum (strain DSM 13744 / JCM 10971 / SI) TaxID=370438 RepID=A5CZ15_PELTS|nr:hypothetical protein PTH_2580 [Pelotomaculum thermopropionicum SI]
MASYTTKSYNNSSMLDCSVREKKLNPNCSRLPLLGKGNHFFQPFGCYYLGIIIEKQKVIAIGMFNSKIIYF